VERSIHAEGRFQLPTLLAFVPVSTGIRAEGELELNADIGGDLQKPQPRVAARIESGLLAHPVLRDQLERLQLNVEYEDDSVRLHQLEAHIGEGTIRASGLLPLAGGAAKLGADVAGLKLESFSDVPEKVSGQVGFHLEAESNRLEDLAAARATVRFDQLRLRYADLELEQEVPTSIRVEDGTATIETLRLAGPKTLIVASGSAELQEPQALDLLLKGDLDAELFGLLAKGFYASGDSRFEVALRGTARQPELSGFFEMQQGQLAHGLARDCGREPRSKSGAES